MISSLTDIQTERRSFLIRMLSSLGVPRDDIEDFAHLALLRFYAKGYADLDLDGKRERALLARIGYSVVVDDSRRRRPLAAGDQCEDVQQGAGLPALHGPDARTAATIARVREWVREAGLGADDVELLESRFAEGLKATEIARRDGLHVNTVRRRLARVIDRLRHVARSEYGDKIQSRSGRP